MVRISYGELTQYEGYEEPEVFAVNDKLDAAIYRPKDKQQDVIIALIRKFEFDLFESFLITTKTLNLLLEQLKARGIE